MCIRDSGVWVREIVDNGSAAGADIKVDDVIVGVDNKKVQMCIRDSTYTVTAMKETLDRSNLGLLKVGDQVNVERSMMMNGRLDGHIVQGHVDQTATCVEIKDAEGSWYFTCLLYTSWFMAFSA